MKLRASAFTRLLTGVAVAMGLVLVPAGSATDDVAVGMLPGGAFVVLDTVVTPELAVEGRARDLIRGVQQARKDAGLQVEDRIDLTIGGRAGVAEAVAAFGEMISAETLATSLGFVELPDHLDPHGIDFTVDDEPVAVTVRRA